MLELLHGRALGVLEEIGPLWTRGLGPEDIETDTFKIPNLEVRPCILLTETVKETNLLNADSSKLVFFSSDQGILKIT